MHQGPDVARSAGSSARQPEGSRRRPPPCRCLAASRVAPAGGTASYSGIQCNERAVRVPKAIPASSRLAAGCLARLEAHNQAAQALPPRAGRRLEVRARHGGCRARQAGIQLRPQRAWIGRVVLVSSHRQPGGHVAPSRALLHVRRGCGGGGAAAASKVGTAACRLARNRPPLCASTLMQFTCLALDNRLPPSWPATCEGTSVVKQSKLSSGVYMRPLVFVSLQGRFIRDQVGNARRTHVSMTAWRVHVSRRHSLWRQP